MRARHRKTPPVAVRAVRFVVACFYMTERKAKRSQDTLDTCYVGLPFCLLVHLFGLTWLLAIVLGTQGAAQSYLRHHHEQKVLGALAAVGFCFVVAGTLRRLAPKHEIDALAETIPPGVGATVGLSIGVGAFLWPFAILALFH